MPEKFQRNFEPVGSYSVEFYERTFFTLDANKMIKDLPSVLLLDCSEELKSKLIRQGFDVFYCDLIY